jgi:hypothetical protein
MPEQMRTGGGALVLIDPLLHPAGAWSPESAMERRLSRPSLDQARSRIQQWIDRGKVHT